LAQPRYDVGNTLPAAAVVSRKQGLVTVHQNTLIVAGREANKGDQEYLHHGERSTIRLLSLVP
jgi:hypothetical protein